MNISELAPDELFADLIPRRQSPPVDNTVQSQIAPRNTPDMPLPKVRTEPAPAPEPSSPQPVNLFADLIPNQPQQKIVINTGQPEAVNLFADLIPQQQTQPEQQPAANLFADLIPANQQQAMPSAIPESDIYERMAALEQEDLDYQKAHTAFQTAKQKEIQNTLAGIQPATGGYSGYPARTPQQTPEPLTEPKMPARDLSNLSKDLGEGIPIVRPNEFGSVINAVETGQLPAAEEADLLGKLEPFLNEDGKQVIEKAILTQQKLKAYEEQAARREAELSNMEIESGLPLGVRRGQHSSNRSQEVTFRAAAKPLTFGFAFSPDKDRLNSDDLEVATNERAKQLFYQRESQLYPEAELAGMLTGNLAMFAGGTGLYRQMLRTMGKAVPATLPAVVKEGLAVEGAITMATRQEGEESKTTPEIIKDRMLATGINATIGAMGDAALFKIGDWLKLKKDKKFQEVLAEEATAAGYSSPEAYINDLTEIQMTDKGLMIKGKREPLTNIDYMEQRANERLTGGPGGMDRQAATGEVSETILTPETPGGRGTETTPTPPDMVQAGTESTGTTTTQPATEGRTQPPVTRENIDSRLSNPEYQDYIEQILNRASESDASAHKANRSKLKIEDDDTLIAAIRKLGGIDRTTMDDTIGDSLRGFITNKFNLNQTLRAKGKGSSLDDMARKLSEVGYTQNGREMTANELAEAIDREIAGRPVFSDAMTSYESHFTLEPTAQPNKVTRPAMEAWLNGETLTPAYRKEIKRLLNEADLDPNFSRGKVDTPDAWRNEFEHADYDPSRYDMVDNHFWQEEQAVSGLRRTDVDAEDLAAIREMERQLQLEDAAALEAKYHTIEEPSNVLREQGNVETIRQRVLGDSQEAARIPQEKRATDLEGRGSGAESTASTTTREGKEKLNRIVRENGAFEKEPIQATELRDLWRKTEKRTSVDDELADIQEIKRLQEELKGFGYSPDEIGAMSNNMTLKEYRLGMNQGTVAPRYLFDDIPGVRQDIRPREKIPVTEQDVYLGKNDMGEPVFQDTQGSRYAYENGHYQDVVRQGQEPAFEKGKFDPVSDIQQPEITQPYAKSGEVSVGKSPDIHVEAPGVGDITVKKNNDGSITADGQPIPKGENYVPNTHKGEPTATSGTVHSNPITFSAQQMARSMNLTEAAFGGAGGGAYAGITSAEENEIGSSKWWLDVMAGASAGVFGSAAGRHLGAWGKGSFTDQFVKHLGSKIESLPWIGRGDPEIRKLKEKQQLMRQVLDRQTGQMGEFLAKNFSPEERAQMSDMIENRGIPKEGSLVARQAQELDDFITFTSERMKELGMLDPDLKTGGYLHRYYSKHLGLDKMFQSAKRQESVSGSYSIRRGTEETFNPNYLSQDVKDRIREYDTIQNRINELEKKSGDMLTSDTMREIEDLKFRREELEALELREYVGVQNGEPHSFIFMSDEVPKVPGMEARPAAGIDSPQMKFGGMDEAGLPATAGDVAGSTQPGATDRVWNLRASAGDQAVLWRDWTKAERTSWGEIEDAGYRFVRGQAEVAHDLSMATMFKKISDNQNWVSDKPRTINGQDWVEIPTTKVHKNSPMRKYGSLAGKYVKPEVWQAIKHYNQPIFGRGKAATLYRNLLNRWKMYKTVYNPVSHFNNTVSNTQMYYMAGYSGKNLGKALGEMRQGENSQYWREARDVGLFGGDWGSSIISGSEGRSGNLHDLAEKLRTQPAVADANQVMDSVDFVTRFKSWMIETGESVKTADTKLKSGAALAKAISEPTMGVIKKPVKAATESAQWLYQKEDELFKLAVFIEERQRGLKPNEAMEAANRFFFDYNDLPDAVRKMKDSPIGTPFVSYTYLATPAIIRNAIERPERMLAIAAAYETLNYAGLQMDGELENQGYWERMDNEKTLNPPWMRGRTAWGALNTLHVPGLDGYKLSLANAHALGNPFAGESGKDLPLWPDFMAFWGPDPIGGNPFTRIPYDVIFNEDWKGSKIYNETASLDEQIRKSLNYAYMNIAPSMPLVPGSWHQQKILEGLAADVGKAEQEGRQPNMLSSSLVNIANSVSAALGGEQFTGADWKGNEYKTTDGLAGSVGVKLRPYRPQDLYMYELNKLRRDLNQVRRDYQLKNKKAARGAYTDQQMDGFKQRFEEDLNSYIEKMKNLENAYRSIR